MLVYSQCLKAQVDWLDRLLEIRVCSREYSWDSGFKSQAFVLCLESLSYGRVSRVSKPETLFLFLISACLLKMCGGKKEQEEKKSEDKIEEELFNGMKWSNSNEMGFNFILMQRKDVFFPFLFNIAHMQRRSVNYHAFASGACGNASKSKGGNACFKSREEFVFHLSANDSMSYIEKWC